MLTSLFSLFYVAGKFHRFLHRGRAQNFGRGKDACYQFYSEICGSQEQMGVTDFWRIARPKTEQDLRH